LDVRNNQGGILSQANFYYLICFANLLNIFPDSKAEIISPRKNSFKGKLFILINGGSFSSTAILCSYLELTKRGVFIGDETAGNKVVISGDPIDMTLPKTRILCEVSTVKYIIRNSNNDGHGITPDYYQIATIDDVVSNKDPAVELALKLVVKSK
jgi:C-terminal processing protease CtpA/Prc